MKFLGNVFILLTLLSFQAFGSVDKCEKLITGIDVGSGTTKIKIGKVDICLQRIKKIVFEKNFPLPFKEYLSKNVQKEFNQEILEKAKTVFAQIKQISENYKVDQIRAVATSAFRDAKNAQTIINEIKRINSIEIIIINQKQEAILGYISALSKDDNNKIDNLIVWDIGGGSMQITMFNKISRYQSYLGQLAAVSFKNLVISKILQKDIVKVTSPNPIGILNGFKALKLAKLEAAKLSNVFKEKIKDPNTKIIGIGGVHNYSIKNQIGTTKNYYTLEELEKIIPSRLELKDEQIGSDYAATDVSNLILVNGFMQELDIEKVYVYKVNLNEALLISDLNFLKNSMK